MYMPYTKNERINESGQTIAHINKTAFGLLLVFYARTWCLIMRPGCFWCEFRLIQHFLPAHGASKNGEGGRRHLRQMVKRLIVAQNLASSCNQIFWVSAGVPVSPWL